MPDVGTGIGAGISLIGGLTGAGSEEGSVESNKTQTQHTTQEHQYGPQWNQSEKQSIFSKILGKINKNFMSSNKQLGQNLATRGLGGGALASGFAGNMRAKNELVSGAATEVETEAMRKILKRVIGDSTGTSSGTATKNEGDFQNFMGDALGWTGGQMSNEGSKLNNWVTGLF